MEQTQEGPFVRVRGEYVPVGSPVEGRSLKAGHAYQGGNSTRAQLRRLRQNWRRFEKACAKSEALQDCRERILDAVADLPYPEFAALQVALAGQIMTDASGEGLYSALTKCLREVEDVLAQKAPADAAL